MSWVKISDLKPLPIKLGKWELAIILLKIKLRHSGLLTSAKKSWGGSTVLSLPRQLFGIIFAELSTIFSWDHRHLPWQPWQINVNYSHRENFSVKRIQQLVFAFIKVSLWNIIFTANDVVIWYVLFMVIGYLRLRIKDICKKVVNTDIRT